MAVPPDLIAFAHRLADAARGETLPRFSAAIAAEDKGGARGFDPVTEADREAERAMRRLIEESYPEHGISGEEFPDREAQGRWTWSLDPIDGTRSFICGMPSWVTLIALLEDGGPVLGVIDAPRLGEVYVGHGERAELNGTAVKVSSCTRIADARLSTTDPFLFEGVEREGFERIRRAARTTRYGHDGYAYARLAAGAIDLVIEAGLQPYDLNALIPVVRAAGGVAGDWDGSADFSRGRIVAAASRELFDEAVGMLG